MLTKLPVAILIPGVPGTSGQPASHDCPPDGPPGGTSGGGGGNDSGGGGCQDGAGQCCIVMMLPNEYGVIVPTTVCL